MAVLSPYIQHLSYEIWKYSVSYSWINGHLSSGITTSWPANQSDAKLLEGGVCLSSIRPRSGKLGRDDSTIFMGMELEAHLLYFTKLSGKSPDFYFLVGTHLKQFVCANELTISRHMFNCIGRVKRHFILKAISFKTDAFTYKQSHRYNDITID